MRLNHIINRHKTAAVKVRGVTIGGGTPVVVQSMTNTDTADVDKTFEQVRDLFLAGSEVVRLTVNNDDAAKGCIALREKLDKEGLDVPLAGCFHYNGHKLLNPRVSEHKGATLSPGRSLSVNNLSAHLSKYSYTHSGIAIFSSRQSR
mgnify:CR=1 FL=1